MASKMVWCIRHKDGYCAAGSGAGRSAPAGVRGLAPEVGLPAGEAGFQGRPEPLSTLCRGKRGEQ